MALPAGMRCEFPISCRQIFKNPLKKPYELIISHENRPPGQTTQWLYTIKPTDLITVVLLLPTELESTLRSCGTGRKNVAFLLKKGFFFALNKVY